MSDPGSGVLLEAHEVLDPVARSAHAARRLVRDLLGRGEREEWTDRAELAVSELVANAVLHAHTPIGVHAALTSSGLRVEVQDTSPVMPVAHDWGAEAATGRGVSLVASFTDGYGVRPLEPFGKAVWFCLSDGVPEVDEAELLADLWEPQIPEGREVLLRSFPPKLWLSAREHHDAILRDLALYLVSHPDAAIPPQRQVEADLARMTISASLDQALPEQEVLPEVIDLTVGVPSERVPAFPVLRDVLNRAEHLAAQQLLLVAPAPADVVAVRDWVCDQVVSQSRGAPAVPWAGARAGPAEPSPGTAGT